jgi:hypothetical protein
MNRIPSPPHHANASKGKLTYPAPTFCSSERMSKDKPKTEEEKGKEKQGADPHHLLPVAHSAAKPHHIKSAESMP